MNKAESDAIYAEIGRIAALSTEVEFTLGCFVCALIDDYQKYTRIIVTELSYGGLIALLLSLYRARNGEDGDFAKLQELTNRANTAQQIRNSIVHSVWRAAGTPTKVTRIKSTAKQKHGYRTQIQNRELSDFQALATEFASLNSDLVDLLKKLIASQKAFDNPVEHPRE